MFLNLGNIGKDGNKGKFGFPFSRTYYREPEIIPKDKRKGEFAVGMYFAQMILPYRKVEGVRLNQDDSDKGADLILFQDGREVPIQVTRLTFNNFSERKAIVKSKSLKFAEQIHQKVQPPFRVLIRIMPNEIYKAPLSSLKKRGRENLEQKLLDNINDFLIKSIPQLQANPEIYTQHWFNGSELSKYFSSIDIQQIPAGFYAHVPGFENIFIDYYAYNSGYNESDIKQTLNKIYDAKNNGRSEILIIWANDYELFERQKIADGLVERFADSSFKEVYFMTFREDVHFWVVKPTATILV